MRNKVFSAKLLSFTSAAVSHLNIYYAPLPLLCKLLLSTTVIDVQLGIRSNQENSYVADTTGSSYKTINIRGLCVPHKMKSICVGWKWTASKSDYWLFQHTHLFTKRGVQLSMFVITRCQDTGGCHSGWGERCLPRSITAVTHWWRINQPFDWEYTNSIERGQYATALMHPDTKRNEKNVV